MTGSTAPSDIWSVGCVIIELSTGSPPYFDMQPMSALYRIVQDAEVPIPNTVSKDLRAFLKRCFEKVPLQPSLTTKGYDHKTPIRTSFDQRFNRYSCYSQLSPSIPLQPSLAQNIEA